MSIDYTVPGVFTDLEEVPADRFDGIGGGPRQLCGAVPKLFIQPFEAEPLGWPSEWFATNQLRPADDLVAALLELAPTSIARPRDRELRAVGTCRHFTVLSVALLRRAGVRARARCGFATYFQPGKGLDHWVVEHDDGGRWVRMDTEYLDSGDVPNAGDLPAGAFQSGAEAWLAYRRGQLDAATYGVYGTDNFGPSEIRGNLVRDLAALIKIETLPWDEWAG